MGLSGLFESLLFYALLAGGGIIVFAFVLGIVVLLWRFKRDRDERLREEFNRTWAEHLDPSAAGNELPDLPDRRVEWFVELWNRRYRRGNEETRQHLRSVASELDLPGRLEPWVTGTQKYHPLVARAGFGHLRDEEHWSLVEASVDREELPLVVLTALCSLREINPSRAVDPLFDQVRQRDDLPEVQVHRVLEKIPAGEATEGLISRLEDADHVERLRLIPYLVDVDRQAARAWCLDHLHEETHPEQLTRILQVLERVGEPEDGERVAQLAGFPAWYVRVHVATTLGKLKYDAGKDALLRLLRDGNWWVRLRAARALKNLPSMTREDLRAIVEDIGDFYARDMLRQEFDPELRREKITL